MCKLEILVEETNKHIFELQPLPVVKMKAISEDLLECNNTVSSTKGSDRTEIYQCGRLVVVMGGGLWCAFVVLKGHHNFTHIS